MGEIAPKEQFLPLSTIFYYLMLDFYVKTGIRLSLRDKRLFEITEVKIMRVNCIKLYIDSPQLRSQLHNHTSLVIMKPRQPSMLHILLISSLPLKATRIPRNAVSRLPALFHKIEVNL